MKKTCFQATAMVSLILSFLILFSSHVGAEFLDLACSSAKGSYTANSSFENNLKLLLQTLPFSTPLTGFNNTSVGEVFGQALCRGDVNSTVCQSCVKEGSHKLLKECKATDAIIWYDSCHVRYSFQNFFSMNVYTGKYPEKSGAYKKIDASDLVRFAKALYCLMTNLTNGAAFDPSKRMFATGEVKFSENSTIYGLLQCTRDISGEDCNSCLSYALAELQGCCNFRQGGIIVSRNCNMRFEMNRFYNAPSNSIICTTKTGGKKKTRMVNLIAAGVPILALTILFGSFVVHLRKKRRNGDDDEKSEKALMQEQASSTELTITQVNDMVNSEDLPFMNLSAIQAATNNFCHTNKLGQGGFGPVYKGLLADGKEIAAKRLSKKSWQGLEEFKNEIVLISKLQHRNLVRLLGCAIEGDEKLLVYEFMPNKSLDMWIFDSKRSKQLDWKTRYSIIGGIAKGLLYLHEDSRLKIIHRDLKASNVLLDHEMVAKISDFGMARIFGENQNTANTRRVVGTYGYMAPEYAMEGLFSVKSDAFSFGVILLEILSGRRNSGFHLTEHAQTLLAYVWRLWNEGRELEFVDPLLVEGGPTEEIVRCIHVGLLCVQEDPADRPTMSSVVVLLGLGDEPISLPQPKQPAFYLRRVAPIHDSSAADPSGNCITVSSISPR